MLVYSLYVSIRNFFNFCDIGASYDITSTNLAYGSDDTRSFLAGSFSSWVPKEIEVYQVSF